MAGEKIVIAQLDLDMQALIKNAAEAKKALTALKEAQKELKNAAEEDTEAIVENEAAIKSVQKAYNTQLKAINDLTEAQIEQGQRQNFLNLVLGQEVASISEAREQNKLLNKLRNETNILTEEGRKELEQLNSQLDRNNEFIKENADGYLKQKINIGNYKDDIKDAFNELNIFNGGLSGFVQRSNEAGGAGNLIKSSFTGAAAGIGNLTKASLAFIATPIGAAIAVITAAVAGMVAIFKTGTSELSKTEQGSQKLSSALAKLNSILTPLTKVFKTFATAVFYNVLDAFEKVYDAGLKVVDMIGRLTSAVGFTSLGKGIQDYTGKVKENAKAQEKINKLASDYEKAQQKARLTQLAYQKDAEKLRQIRDDVSKSDAARLRANEQLGALLTKQAREEIAIQQLNLNRINAEVKLKGKTKALENERIQALTEIADIEERITGQRSEQLTNTNSLKKEAADRAKAARDAQIAAAKAAKEEAKNQLDAELRLFLANNAAKYQSNEAQLAAEEEAHKKRLAIIEAEYQASEKRKSDEINRDAAIQEAENNIRMTRINQAQKIAETELAIYKEKNSKVLTENKFINDAIYKQELDRINGLQGAEMANLAVQLHNKTISLEQYQLQSLQIENTYNAQKDALRIAADQQEQQRRATDLQNRIDGVRNNFVLEYQLRSEQIELQREQEIAAAEQTGADKAAINEKYNLLQQEQDEILNENKLSLASSTFGNLAKIFGENSRAGKAMAVMQTTIDTYQSATAAFKSMAGIPIVGPALGAVAAGAAIASGIANVKKITSTKEPKFKTGGIFEVGGRLHNNGGTKFVGSDGSRFEAERGEGIGILSRPEFAAFNNFRAGLRSVNDSLNFGTATNNNFILDAIRAMPAPVVAIEDINKGQKIYNKIVNYADL